MEWFFFVYIYVMCTKTNYQNNTHRLKIKSLYLITIFQIQPRDGHRNDTNTIWFATLQVKKGL